MSWQHLMCIYCWKKFNNRNSTPPRTKKNSKVATMTRATIGGTLNSISVKDSHLAIRVLSSNFCKACTNCEQASISVANDNGQLFYKTLKLHIHNLYVIDRQPHWFYLYASYSFYNIHYVYQYFCHRCSNLCREMSIFVLKDCYVVSFTCTIWSIFTFFWAENSTEPFYAILQVISIIIPPRRLHTCTCRNSSLLWEVTSHSV